MILQLKISAMLPHSETQSTRTTAYSQLLSGFLVFHFNMTRQLKLLDIWAYYTGTFKKKEEDEEANRNLGNKKW
jgi:hypothetical protein